MKTPSPGLGVIDTRWCANVPFVSDCRRTSAVVPSVKPASMRLFSPASSTTPRFGFRGLARRGQARADIPGIHLDGEHLMRVEEFQQNGKRPKRCASFPINCSRDCAHCSGWAASSKTLRQLRQVHGLSSRDRTLPASVWQCRSREPSS